MADAPIHCSVIAPEAEVFDDRVSMVVVPAHDGEIGILANRAPLVCRLGAGLLRVKTGAEEQSWFVDGGFAQVLNNRVIVLTQKAILPERIDRAAAQAQLDQARRMKATDEVAARRKALTEASARAQLRIAVAPAGR